MTGLLHHTGTEQAWERGFVPVCEVGDFSYERFKTWVEAVLLMSRGGKSETLQEKC